MQMITNLSKYLVLAVLSGLFLITWNGIKTNDGIQPLGSLNEIYSQAEVTPIPTVTMPTATIPTTPITTILQNTTNDNNLSPTEVSSIWHNVSSEFKLDHKTQTRQVQAEIRKLMADKDNFNHILKSATPYIYFIYQQTQAYGLPSEIALIPFIESEFNPNDHSTAGALGLWQLMPSTARELGVRVKSSYDGRKNIIASTDAALTYFKDLGTLFNGNWYLAIAAYNSGEGRILSAKKRIGSEDFFKMPLPRETQLYVPKLLAVAEIVEHPEKYGITLPAVNNEPFFTKVEMNKPVTLAKVAETSGINIQTLRKLNPDVKPGTMTVAKKDGSHELLVPTAKASSVHT